MGKSTNPIPTCTARHAGMEGQAVLLAASLFLGATIVEAQVKVPGAAAPHAPKTCQRADWRGPALLLALRDQFLP